MKKKSTIVPIAEKKFLTTEELIRMRESHIWNMVHNRNVIMADQALKLLEHKYKEVQAGVEVAKNRKQEFVDEHRAFKDSLCIKYKLPEDGFQFDPDTGELGTGPIVGE